MVHLNCSDMGKQIFQQINRVSFQSTKYLFIPLKNWFTYTQPRIEINYFLLSVYRGIFLYLQPSFSPVPQVLKNPVTLAVVLFPFMRSPYILPLHLIWLIPFQTDSHDTKVYKCKSIRLSQNALTGNATYCWSSVHVFCEEKSKIILTIVRFVPSAPALPVLVILAKLQLRVQPRTSRSGRTTTSKTSGGA